MVGDSIWAWRVVVLLALVSTMNGCSENPEALPPESVAPESAADAGGLSEPEPGESGEEPAEEGETPEGEPGAEAPEEATAYPDPPPETVHDERPATVHIPDGYDASEPTPLVILLHGYSASGFLNSLFLRFGGVASERGYLYVTPDGTRDAAGFRYWHATGGCCGTFATDVDDVAYLVEVIEAMKASFNVDPSRVYLFGHSNGGFMAYRMACEAAEHVTAIASLAGGTWFDAASCTNPDPVVSVLQIHGTWDVTIQYEGREGDFPSALETVERWATRASCDLDASEDMGRFDAITLNPGDETSIRRYETGCAAGTGMELWTMDRGGHAPILRSEAIQRTFDFFDRHTR